MLAQREQLHGLDDRMIDDRAIETRAEGSIMSATKIVTREAGEVQPREHLVKGLANEQVLEQQQKVENVVDLVSAKVERDEVAIVKENTHLNGHEKEDHTNKFKAMLTDVKRIEDNVSPGPQVEEESEKKSLTGKYKDIVRAHRESATETVLEAEDPTLKVK